MHTQLPGSGHFRILAALGLVAFCFPTLWARSASVSVSSTNVAFNASITVSESVSADSGDVLFNNFAWYRKPDGSTGIVWGTYTDYYWQNSRTASDSITLNQEGTWSFYAYGYTGDAPNTQQVIESGATTVYVNAPPPPPVPAINSSLDLWYQQGETISYSITASNSPTGFTASGLPAGLSVNTSTGVISGRITNSGTISSSISAGNSYGSDTRTLVWHITAASITAIPSVTPSPQALGSSVTLTRSGSANFGIAWIENVIWRPNSGPISLGNLSGVGSQSYTPNDGIGTYWYQIRVVDVNSNYVDGWQSFVVADPPVATVTLSPSSIAFGQSSSVTMGLTQSAPGTLSNHWMLWDQGNGSFWTGIGFMWNYQSTTGMSSISSLDGNPTGSNSSSKSLVYTPNFVGYVNFLSWGSSTVSSGPGTYNISGLSIAQATPTITFSGQTLSGATTLSGSHLNATASNPYSGAVSAPTGSFSYAITAASGSDANSTGAISSGTVLQVGNYAVRASYPGNTNYTPNTKDVSFVVSGPTRPGSFTAAVVGSTFVTLTWTASSSPSGINRYAIYRTPIGGSESWIANVFSGTTYTDSTVNFTTGYTYRIIAVDNASVASASVSLSTATAASFEVFTPL